MLFYIKCYVMMLYCVVSHQLAVLRDSIVVAAYLPMSVSGPV